MTDTIREIKFRGKRVDNGGWVRGYLYSTNAIIVLESTYTVTSLGTLIQGIYEVIPETVGQYIERKDKNGVEIFEGDIIEHDLTTYTYLGIVCFLTGHHISGFSVRWEGRGCSVRMETCKVIGNIHDSKEDSK